MAGATTGNDAIVQALVGMLQSYLSNALLVVYTERGLDTPDISAIVDERTPPARWGNSVLVMHVSDEYERGQYLGMNAPTRHTGECRILCLVSRAKRNDSQPHRRLWARAVETTILRYWRAYDDNAACFFSLRTSTDTDKQLDELRRYFRGGGDNTAGDTKGATTIDPVMIRVFYGQYRQQTTEI